MSFLDNEEPGKQEEQVETPVAMTDEKQATGEGTGAGVEATPEEVSTEEDLIAGYRRQIEALEQEVAARSGEAAEYGQQLQRLQADFINFRKRVRREQEELGRMVTEDLMRQLLPVVDNLERAIAAAGQEGASLENLYSGVVLVHRQLGELLSKEGVSPMTSVGEIFDPTKHHAVASVESEEYAEGTVVDELQKGYLFGDRVLRPAMVRVAQRPSEGQ